NVFFFFLNRIVYLTLISAIVCWLALDTARQGTNQLISFGGLVMYIVLMFIFSKHPTKVSWRVVCWGLGLQFILGLLILRTEPGFTAFEWLGTQVQIFLDYTDAGSKFVFGEKYTDHNFAFKVLPIVIFFSTVISILYYIGFMQWLILKVGWIVQVTMGTTPTESLVAAGNIFVGMTESPLLIRPYLPLLTKSEIHAIMTAGFATIAGSVLGAYISFGVSASHLLTASVMSAPASLAIAKLFWPETETPKISNDEFKMERGGGRNLIEAASLGASTAVPLVANIAANLIAFLALLEFLNAVLSWLGNMFDYQELSFEVICSYVFMPFVFMMGVAWEDSFIVAKLIGYKTFFNEFVAYDHLAVLIQKRTDGGPEYIDGVKQYLTVRSETITIYALCGFANFGSLGIVVGALASLAPQRKSDIADCAIRALIAGTVACFMTACIAGILLTPFTDVPVICHSFLEETFSSKLPGNNTQLIDCCIDLFNSTVVNSPTDVILTGNYTVTSLQGCCNMLDPLSFNCTWF
uniref:Sodium/nucleoside cotransporter n=1 Tax=Latimeria chalumnae TaxID=7897 RepID=H2ZUV3_LATCH